MAISDKQSNMNASCATILQRTIRQRITNYVRTPNHRCGGGVTNRTANVGVIQSNSTTDTKATPSQMKDLVGSIVSRKVSSMKGYRTGIQTLKIPSQLFEEEKQCQLPTIKNKSTLNPIRKQPQRQMDCLQRTCKIQFYPAVSYIEIPSYTEYNDEEKQKIWTNRQDIKRMVKKNRKEKLYEKYYNHGNVVEDDDYCLYDGQIIHPAHLPKHILFCHHQEHNVRLFERYVLLNQLHIVMMQQAQQNNSTVHQSDPTPSTCRQQQQHPLIHPTRIEERLGGVNNNHDAAIQPIGTIYHELLEL